MCKRQILIVLAVGAFLPTKAHATPASFLNVNVRVYNTARAPTETRRGALVVASHTLGASRISVDWFDCEVADTCGRPPAAGELVVRLVRAPSAGTPAAPFVLGEAWIDTAVRAGVLASIYIDRVELMATLSETDVVSLLGRALAHEIGHLLMASNTHGPIGLMRAFWSSSNCRP